MSSFTIDSDWPGPYVDGEWRALDGEPVNVINPATREAIQRIPFGAERDVDDAYEAVLESQPAWGDSPHERIGVLEDVVDQIETHADEIAEAIALESGSTLHKAHNELRGAIGVLDAAVELTYRCQRTESPSSVPGKRNIVRREPAGAVGVITPWNVPFKLAFQSVAPALALGNGVVLKPAPETPISGGLIVARLFERAGAPPGVINVVPGYGEGAGERVVDHPDVSVISFTGSSAVGRTIARTAAEDFTPAMLELGGNNPHIVTDDADLDLAVDGGAFATFSHQGQACISINRHLVHESVYDEYVARLTERAKDLTLGDPLAEDVDLGPVINETQRDRIVDFVERTLDRGATLETGGGFEDLFVEPTVLSGVANDMPVACNEHFGPVAPIIEVADDEEAVAVANDTEYGLSASVHARDLDRAHRIADELESGMVHINDQTVNSDPRAPFGGVKASGIGRHNGEWALDKYTTTKWVSVQDEPREYPLG